MSDVSVLNLAQISLPPALANADCRRLDAAFVLHIASCMQQAKTFYFSIKFQLKYYRSKRQQNTFTQSQIISGSTSEQISQTACQSDEWMARWLAGWLAVELAGFLPIAQTFGNESEVSQSSEKQARIYSCCALTDRLKLGDYPCY